MARKKRASPKTDLVREYIALHPELTTSQVVSDLKGQGISESLVIKVKQQAGRKGKRGTKMSAKKVTRARGKAEGGTQADEIREVALSLTKPFRPKDVRDVLAERGIPASTSVIGKVLRRMGMKRRRRRRKAAAGAAPAAAASSGGLNINDLVAAKKLVAEVGSIEKVREVLAALARLS
jgi:transposase